MIIRKKFLKVFIVLLALAMLLPYAPIKAITIDSENEYNLYIDDYPSDISSVYAKFKTSKKNNEDYALNLIEDDEEEFIKAISNLKIDVEEENIALGFTTELIYTDPESGDDSKKTDAVIVLCSLPDDAQEHPDDCLFYQISGGKAKLVPSQRVKDEEGVIYEKFELPSYGMYGFVYKNPDSYEEEDDEDGNDDDNDDGDENDEDIKKYTGNNHDPIEPEDDSRFEYTEDDDTDDDGFEYTEDDDDDFDSDDFVSDDGTIEEFDSDAEDDDDDVPYYYEKEDDIGYYTEDKSKTNAEAGNTGNNENSSSSSSVSENAGSQTDTSDHHVLDNTGSTEYDFNTSGRTSTTDTSYSGAVPKTGDEFPLTETISIGAISLVLLIGTIILLKKKH